MWARVSRSTSIGARKRERAVRNGGRRRRDGSGRAGRLVVAATVAFLVGVRALKDGEKCFADFQCDSGVCATAAEV